MRKCTCVRCKAEEFIHGIYPNLDDRRVLLAAQAVVNALHASVKEMKREAA